MDGDDENNERETERERACWSSSRTEGHQCRTSAGAVQQPDLRSPGEATLLRALDAPDIHE